jgi:hypothetical protein
MRLPRCGKAITFTEYDIMGLLRMTALGAVGYAAYRYLKRDQAGHEGHTAFASGESGGANFAKVRNAGPEGMRSNPPSWDQGIDRYAFVGGGVTQELPEQRFQTDRRLVTRNLDRAFHRGMVIHRHRA